MSVRFAPRLLCLVVTSLVACTHPEPSAPNGLFFPTVERLDAYPSALLSSRLEERSGCLIAGAEGGRGGLVLLWPDGYAAGAVPDGPIQVLDDNGTVVGTVGERVELGGGIVGASYDAQIDQQTPDACGHHYWLVALSS